MCILCKMGMDKNALHDGTGGSSGVFNNSQFLNPATPAYIGSLILGYSLSGNTNSFASATYGTASADTGLVSSMQYAAGQAMNIANINLTQMTGSAANNSNFFFSTADLLSSGGLGVTYPDFTGTRIFNADIEIDRTLNHSKGVGDGLLTVLHELGHALGLKHPDNYGGGGEIGPFFEPTYNGSVMSYVGGNPANDGNQPTTFMIYDIAALQYLYGANMNYNKGNNVYNFDGQTFTGAIWDAGGLDAIVTNDADGAIIDLREGVQFYSSAGIASIWNAFGSNIENATTASGNDFIYGNDLNNALTSGAGNDYIAASKGSDVLSSGAGNDTIFGGRGNDIILGGADNDQVSGDNGDDVLRGGKNNDVLLGGNGSDIISGDKGNDFLVGGEGVDIFQFRAESADDVISDFQDEIDKIMISPDIFASGQAAADAVEYGSFGGAFLVLGGQGSIEIVGVAFGVLNASDFIISPS